MKITPLLYIAIIIISADSLHAADNHWRTANDREGIQVVTGSPEGAPEGETWFHLIDDSNENAANLRHGIKPIMEGSLSFRINIAKPIDISVNLGDGPASKPAERVVQVIINYSGRVKIQLVKPSVMSDMALNVGENYDISIRFKPNGENATDVIVDISQNGVLLETVEAISPVSRPIDMFRITTYNADFDGEFYVTNLALDGK
ncbi:MAG: hypothetical protein ACSHX8_11470 [Opitutaceae bacterium]